MAFNFISKRSIWLAILLIFLSGLSQVMVAESKDSIVKMTWAEFRQLLNLDSDEIVLSFEEFKILSMQAGKQAEIDYAVKEGKIVLGRKQFKQLLDRMRPPESHLATPPSEYVITKAVYQGKMSGENTRITAVFNIEIFNTGQTKYYQIPLIHKQAGLTKVLIDGTPALVTEKSGWYMIHTKESGLHQVQAEFYIHSKLNQGTSLIQLRVVKTAITLLNLDVPLKDIDIQVQGAKELEIMKRDSGTGLRAVLPATTRISVSAFRKHKEMVESAKQEPAKIYAETVHLISIEEDALRVLSRIKLNILQRSIYFVKIAVPADYNILYIRQRNGKKIRDWQLESPDGEKDSEKILKVPFDSPRKGNVRFDILSERLFDQKQNKISFQGFRIIDSIRETGYIGAEKKSTAEAVPSDTSKLDRIDIKDLPSDLVSLSNRPLLFGFRYLRHPYDLTMAITRHEELPTISTIIDMLSLISVILEDGKRLTKASFTVRNTWKQFLELKLPEGAEVWTVYVDNKRENVSKNKKGSFMVPLARSKSKQQVLQSFKIDLIYFNRSKRFHFFGQTVIQFPIADIMVSKMLWSVYLPRNYRYLHFKGDVEKEEIAQTVNLLFGKGRQFDLKNVKRYNEVARIMEKSGTEYERGRRMDSFEQSVQSQFSNSYIGHKDLAQQIRQEANLNFNIQQEQGKSLGTPGSGGNIFRIELPTSGKIFRFNRTVIEGEAIELTIFYSSPLLILIIKAVILLILIGILFLSRKAIVRTVQKQYGRIRNLVQKWSFIYSKNGLRCILLTLALLSLFISMTLFIFFVILFTLSIFIPNILMGLKREISERKKTEHPEKNMDTPQTKRDSIKQPEPEGKEGQDNG